MITNQLFLLKSVLAAYRAKACRGGRGKVICVWSLCMSHLQRWWEIMATVWWLSKPQTAQLDSIWVKLESKCCPIITLWTFFSALRFDFSTITITQWPYRCQDAILAPDKLFKSPSGSQTVNVYGITKWYYLWWNFFFLCCVLVLYDNTPICRNRLRCFPCILSFFFMSRPHTQPGEEPPQWSKQGSATFHQRIIGNN